MAEEEDEAMELEAVQAVYGDDCVLVHSCPPHLHLHMKPRTADIYSQQFVEAVIGIQAAPKHPEEQLHVYLIASKGLDEKRQKCLIDGIQDKACELSSCPMLVQLCEEAIERLSVMNHPDGDCPLCLYPLVPEDDQSLPFMKLMSCFHCFHSECIIRWWNWQQKEKESNPEHPSITNAYFSRDTEGADGVTEERLGNCPVCRKVFHVKDFEHVLDLVGTRSSQLTRDATEDDDDEKLLQSDSEIIRRQQFEAILKLQEEKGGLTEPKKNIVVLPGMYLQNSITPSLGRAESEPQEREVESARLVKTDGSGSSKGSGQFANRNLWRKKQRGRDPRKAVGQWVRKENGAGE